jgi:hypothetical protein
MRVSLKYDLQLSEIVCQITNTLAQEYEDIKARKTSQRSNQVSSVATLPLNGIRTIQNEGMVLSCLKPLLRLLLLFKLFIKTCKTIMP